LKICGKPAAGSTLKWITLNQAKTNRLEYMIEIIIASIGIASGFLAVVMIGYVFLKKYKSEHETFKRKHAEDAMRIKAKHYRKTN
jgi:uncharacterized membrane protein